MRRLAHGRVCFNWYRIAVTIPERVGDLDPSGSTVVFEVAIDDYAEVWVNGELPHALGDTSGPVVGGFNAPNRVVLARDARPGERFQIAVFGINGPISASPHNYIWMRTATLDFYPERARAAGRRRSRSSAPRELEDRPRTRSSNGRRRLRVHRGAGVVARGRAALQLAQHERRSTAGPRAGKVTRVPPQERLHRRRHRPLPPAGLERADLRPGGRLTICQHGNRRVIRVNPHGDITVLADAYEGKRLNSPNDLVYRSDGTRLLHRPAVRAAGACSTTRTRSSTSAACSACQGRRDALIDDELEGPNGLAFSPDERYLYVGNWDPERKVIMRYEIDEAGDGLDREVFYDMTGAPGEDALDGLKVDEAGNVYVCGPGGIWVLSAGGRAARPDQASRGPAQPGLGRRGRSHASTSPH